MAIEEHDAHEQKLRQMDQWLDRNQGKAPTSYRRRHTTEDEGSVMSQSVMEA